jgi:carbamoylphosphate synthase small subunit
MRPFTTVHGYQQILADPFHFCRQIVMTGSRADYPSFVCTH